MGEEHSPSTALYSLASAKVIVESIFDEEIVEIVPELEKEVESVIREKYERVAVETKLFSFCA